ncbi:molybdate ABC transporter substrate-binding protein [Planctomicrobium sp. SH668]|uniref:molybdate ABC transporter substrate-binding protein n=1 Tax=Planctomicrobium sp. SH668 TaxID=3448126 RepID=UPI003F5C9240
MNRPILLILTSIVLAATLAFSLSSPWNHSSTSAKTEPPLLLYCAASNRAVMSEIAQDYFEEVGVPIEFQFGPSQSLLSSIEISRTGDLYLPADSSYLDIARQRNLVTEATSIATMQVVLGVADSNPLSIRSFSDLLRDDVRVVQANPEVAAVGKLTRDVLTSLGKWEILNQHTAAFVSSVTEAANSVKSGAADVAIVYDAVLTSYPDLEMVSIPEFENTVADIQIAILFESPQPEQAREFVRFLTASDRGLAHYRKFGFHPVAGAPWKKIP